MDELKNQTFPFLKLPPEIRNEIYRYLLCTKYTKHLTDSPRTHFPMLWPSYRYEFHTTILRTSRQIYHEATYLARRENIFVLIKSSSSYPMDAVYQKASIDLEASGLGHRVMDVELGWIRSSFGCEFTTDYLICYDQLLPLCEGLLQFSERYIETETRMTYKIAVLDFPQDSKLASTTIPMSTQQQLLEPFMMLSHAHECYIDGPVSPEYKAKIIRQVCRQDWSPEGCLQETISLMKEGKDAFLEFRFADAVYKYVSALKMLIFKIYTLQLNGSIIPAGEFSGYTYNAITHRYLLWKIPSNIVAAYLKLHQWQDAYDWAWCAVYNVGTGDHSPRDFAVLLFRLALVNNELGEHERAGKEYRRGNMFADSHFKGVKEDREIGALRLALTVPNGGHLDAALEETTV